jgi:NAD(P)-dependent dehydrogenase (short-subunit alcohol dehydrogenase family)
MGTILITGASSGIGEAAALLLAKDHAVCATVRTEAARTTLLAKAAAASVAVDVALLDVCDLDAVRGLVGTLEAAGGIDVLVQNAGTGFVGTLEQLDLDALRRALEVNFFGAAQVIQAVLPGMRTRGHGRILAVSSVGGAVGQPFNDAYCAAKFALEGLLESLAPVAATVGVAISIIEPGPVATKFIANVQGLDAVLDGGADDPYASAKANYMARLGSPERMVGMQTSEDVAEVIAEVIDATTPALRYQTSPWSTGFVATKLGDVTGDAVISMTSAWVAD